MVARLIKRLDYVMVSAALIIFGAIRNLNLSHQNWFLCGYQIQRMGPSMISNLAIISLLPRAVKVQYYKVGPILASTVHLKKPSRLLDKICNNAEVNA